MRDYSAGQLRSGKVAWGTSAPTSPAEAAGKMPPRSVVTGNAGPTYSSPADLPVEVDPLGAGAEGSGPLNARSRLDRKIMQARMLIIDNSDSSGSDNDGFPD